MDQQETPANEKEQLNAVLDAALDALDDDEDEEPPPIASTGAAKTASASPQQDAPGEKQQSKPAFGPEVPPEFNIGSFDDVMKQMFQGGGDGDPEAALDAFMQQLQSQLVSEMEMMESTKPESPTVKSDKSAAEKVSPSPSVEVPPPSENDVDRTISKLLNDMATANDMSEDEGVGSVPGGEEAMFHDMMKEFEKMGNGGGFDQDAAVDGMMQQLLAKEIMYEPMKQVTDRFPSWLEKNKDSLSEEEYKNRSEQYKCFQELIQVYDNEPDNVKKLMELMQDVQEYGQPPPAIIKEIAPGLDLDEEGVPKLDGLGGLPFGENEECSIM